MSARDYVESTENYLTYYKLVGVHSNSRNGILDFAQRVPNNAEVVVDYRAIIVGDSDYIYYSLSGTALIPKDKRES